MMCVSGKDEQLILFGKPGHPEVDGVAGYSAAGKLFIISSADEVDTLPDLPHPVFISQTTVDHGEVNAALDKLKCRFPQIRECSNICDASWKRQKAILELSKKCDAVLVIGSAHSSNARRLMEIARRTGVAAFLIDDASQITPEMFSFARIGVTSGASTPQYLFDGVIAALEDAGFSDAKKEADS
jgi:4-hydroxy-3-methylbut-2-enyl diphosphate reductase